MEEGESWELVTTIAGLHRLLDRVEGGTAALDFETTALKPAEGTVRLASVCNDDVWALVDFWAIGAELGGDPTRGFERTAHWFSDTTWIVFNKGFELRWFIAADAEVTLWDAGYAHQAVEGGGPLSLAILAKKVLKRTLDKTEQASNWGAPELRDEQLDYAALDSLDTWDIWRATRMDAGQRRAAAMFDDMVPAVIEMEETGIMLDPVAHQRLVNHWVDLENERYDRMREAISEAEIPNLNSQQQVSKYFSKLLPSAILKIWPRTEKTGLLSTKTTVLREMATVVSGTPLAEFLLTMAEFKTLGKYISSFGETLITKGQLSGDWRIRARYNIARAVTGRFSSSGPNLQQVPRDKDMLGERMSIRSSFVAAPGRMLVSLDYSGIELRVLALLSGDEQMLHDILEGDLHSEVAAILMRRKIDKKDPTDSEIRSIAKRGTFAIVYGASAPGVAAGIAAGVGNNTSLGLSASVTVGQQLIDGWRARYPRAFDMRNVWQAEAKANGGYLRMVDGGTINMGSRPSITQCANYPVQRGALAVMAKAIARHKMSLDHARNAGRIANAPTMLSTIHDALIDEAAEADARAVFDMMERDMTLGFLDIFPGADTSRLVEGGIGRDWGHLEPQSLATAITE